MSHIETPASQRVPADAACVVCSAVAPEAARAGWHVFDDGTGEEHALCPACLKGGHDQPTGS